MAVFINSGRAGIIPPNNLSQPLGFLTNGGGIKCYPSAAIVTSDLSTTSNVLNLIPTAISALTTFELNLYSVSTAVVGSPPATIQATIWFYTWAGNNYSAPTSTGVVISFTLSSTQTEDFYALASIGPYGISNGMVFAVSLQVVPGGAYTPQPAEVLRYTAVISNTSVIGPPGPTGPSGPPGPPGAALAAGITNPQRLLEGPLGMPGVQSDSFENTTRNSIVVTNRNPQKIGNSSIVYTFAETDQPTDSFEVSWILPPVQNNIQIISALGTKLQPPSKVPKLAHLTSTESGERPLTRFHASGDFEPGEKWSFVIQYLYQ